jgi:hypothetical protein
MILVNLFVNNSSGYELFDTKSKVIDFNPTNMDEIRKYIINYLPDYLKSHFYSIFIINKSEKTNINVYFEYNKNIIRDLKINRVLNKRR